VEVRELASALHRIHWAGARSSPRNVRAAEVDTDCMARARVANQSDEDRTTGTAPSRVRAAAAAGMGIPVAAADRAGCGDCGLHAARGCVHSEAAGSVGPGAGNNDALDRPAGVDNWNWGGFVRVRAGACRHAAAGSPGSPAAAADSPAAAAADSPAAATEDSPAAATEDNPVATAGSRVAAAGSRVATAGSPVAAGTAGDTGRADTEPEADRVAAGRMRVVAALGCHTRLRRRRRYSTARRTLEAWGSQLSPTQRLRFSLPAGLLCRRRKNRAARSAGSRGRNQAPNQLLSRGTVAC
jgi:hypothetical protein